MPGILLLEPNDLVRRGLEVHLAREYFEVFSTGHPGQARALVKEKHPDLVILALEDTNGDELAPLRWFTRTQPEIKVIVTSALASLATAVESMKLQAVDFLLKPFPPQELVQKVREHLAAPGPCLPPAPDDDVEDPFGQVIGESRAIQNIRHLMESISKSDLNVLLSGESGVGKTFFAHLVHGSSQRRTNPLLSLDCAVFSNELFLESELFGLGRADVPGAGSPREGAIVKAGRGTLIIEGIGSLPPGLQAKLLNFLETGEIRRVGENLPITADTRIIATLGDPGQAADPFPALRPDLLFRLKKIFIEIPPLRKRREDIALFIHFFLRQASDQTKVRASIDKKALSSLCSLPFPGNVLELKNLIEQILLVSREKPINKETLERAGVMLDPVDDGVQKKIASAEKEIIRQVVLKHPRDLNAAAQALGLSRTTLWRRMKKHGLIEKKTAPRRGARKEDTTGDW